MARYILRRVLQMIPTVLGVMLITFVLFNVVGGSPASMTLGPHVTPQALEDFGPGRARWRTRPSTGMPARGGRRRARSSPPTPACGCRAARSTPRRWPSRSGPTRTTA
ncbi:MAG: hypothetical protein NTV49_02435 [Kiritimatiellaeota bacterium]|nr:hypothetical protein [Kiritimatiellota bacterium]